jgi:hypothetical protein
VNSWYVTTHKNAILLSFFEACTNWVLLYTLCNITGRANGKEKSFEDKEGKQVTSLLPQVEDLCLRMISEQK